MGLRILLVEDEPDVADFITRGLREEGFSVERSADGNAALRALHRADWDLVLLDWWLPGRDGIDVVKRFRQSNHQTPVLFLTARDGVAERVEGLDAGADDYLCKPFAFDELLARVRALTRRGGQRQGTRLSYRDVSLDLATHRAERAGHALALTTKEHSLLVFFLRHVDQVLSRTRIYEQVWDEHYDGCSNTLEVHVMELRRKLEARGPRLIHTLRGRGYLFGKSPEEAV
jgi:two-component system copper resistance phosphate regulon response regulator CusR